MGISAIYHISLPTSGRSEVERLHPASFLRYYHMYIVHNCLWPCDFRFSCKHIIVYAIFLKVRELKRLQIAKLTFNVNQFNWCHSIGPHYFLLDFHCKYHSCEVSEIWSVYFARFIRDHVTLNASSSGNLSRMHQYSSVSICTQKLKCLVVPIMIAAPKWVTWSWPWHFHTWVGNCYSQPTHQITSYENMKGNAKYRKGSVGVLRGDTKSWKLPYHLIRRLQVPTSHP